MKEIRDFWAFLFQVVYNDLVPSYKAGLKAVGGGTQSEKLKSLFSILHVSEEALVLSLFALNRYTWIQE